MKLTKRKPRWFKVVVSKTTDCPVLVAPITTPNNRLVAFNPKYERVVVVREVKKARK